jgi:alpha-tubulin suppressor-like RCC1 family protein
MFIVGSLRGSLTTSTCAGAACSFILNPIGRVYAWGSNRNLEIGMRDQISFKSKPELMKQIRKYKITQIVSSASQVGQSHPLALTEDGRVLGFGTQREGGLCLGEGFTRSTPALVSFALTNKIKKIACGLRHTLLLDFLGKIWACGDNRQSQLGIGDPRLTRAFNPMPVLMVDAVTAIAAGDAHSLAVGEDNSVWSWGLNASGQLGIGNFSPQPSPIRLNVIFKTVDSIVCGSQHSLAITDGGKNVHAWGSNNCGQLGIGKLSVTESVPLLVNLGSGFRRIVQAAAAGTHTLLVDHSGELLVCGDNFHGQLGLEEKKRALPDPTVVVELRQFKIKMVATADKHSICLANSQ